MRFAVAARVADEHLAGYVDYVARGESGTGGSIT